MKRILILTLAVLLLSFGSAQSFAQTCTLTMQTAVTESRCMATGSITVTVSNGSGNYNYTVTGGSFSTNTSSNVISGLAPGSYDVKVKDLTSGCTVEQSNVVVTGTYQDPRFTLATTDATCYNSATGSITVTNLQYGRAPFTYSIVAPSASSIGTSNNTGVFNNLVPGSYSIQLTDSCGGIQTRIAIISNYTWNFSIAASSKTACGTTQFTLTATDYLGNSNTNSALFNSFTYGFTNTLGDTTWSSNRVFSATTGTKRNGTLIVKDGCGNIKTIAYTDNKIPNVNGWVNTGNLTCSGFDASISGQQNLTTPTYCLYTNASPAVQITCNSTGSFTNVPYGSYYIEINDPCYDTTFRRYFAVSATLPTADPSVILSNKTCSGFTATAPWTSISNPQYCLKDSNNATVACNTTGVFNNLPYGSYCMTITEPCSGGVISRCFTAVRQKPALNGVTTSNLSCSSFTATAYGGVNITNGQYCLYDASNNVIACNTTGVFNNLAYGTYCLHLQNDPSCYDTLIVSCFTVGQPVPSVSGSVSISNKGCSSFTATITGQQNLNNPQYCLYDSVGTQITCNTTGVFSNVAYGSYCIKITNDPGCYDTLITRCFTVGKPAPVAPASVSFTKSCATFNASIQFSSNFNNPQYELYDGSNNLIATNTNGNFTNIPYGSYCIKMINDPACYDTTITRCFTQSALSLGLSGSSSPSCTLGYSNLRVVVSNGTAPYTATVYDPAGTWAAQVNTSSSTININDILNGLASGQQYKVVVQSACGKDSILLSAPFNTLTKSINATAKCPGGLWLNGSGDLLVNVVYTGGSVIPSITQKNGASFPLNYSTVSGNNYTFSNLEPATYIIKYYMPSCSKAVYDTFTLASYAYPNLNKSAVYQCNNNNFSVSAAVTGGVAPFTYEIIGSQPSSPSIIAGPQAAPTFSISNGVSYSLVRLRAVDACGNATINDASILPLANTIITASSDCYYNNINLSVDTVANATYTWYKKTSSIDSTLISSNQTYTIPYLLPSDTGTYVNVMSVNSGCLTRVSSFNVTGMCGGLLSINGLSFSGAADKNNVQLKWTTVRAFDAVTYVVERSGDGINFSSIGTQAVSGNNAISASQYFYSDINPLGGKSYYRLRIVSKSGKISYSEVVTVNMKRTVSVSVMPNPVVNAFSVHFEPVANSNFEVSLLSADGKTVFRNKYAVHPGDVQTIQRPSALSSGVYYLVVVNQSTNEKEIIKLFFK